MPEILTESFCERCGTRYTFESAAPRKARRLGQFKTLGKGVKNWVLSDDSSLDEAMAAARGDEEREVTAQQLDAFHATFNFCMNCRQYTCANCWNTAEGRCLTCAPNLGQDVLPAPFSAAVGFEAATLDVQAWPEVDLVATSGSGLGVEGIEPIGANGADHVHNGADHWPDDQNGNGAAHEDVPDIDAVARLAFLAGETTDERFGEAVAATDAPAIDAAIDADQAGHVAAASAESPASDEEWRREVAGISSTPDEPGLPASLPDDIDGRAAAGAARTADLLARFRPGQSLDAELEAYEAELEARERAAGAAASAPSQDLPPVDELEPDATGADVAAAAVGAEPADTDAAVAAEPAAATAAAPAPDAPSEIDAAPEADVAAPPEASRPRDDLVEQPTWRIFAPDATAPTAPPSDVPAPQRQPAGLPSQASADPQWPARPDIAESPAMALLASRARSDALWAASAQEVIGGPGARPAAAPTGVQPCSNCGLSLSANARFCRRCGTRQG
jgi:hypothetical protein